MDTIFIYNYNYLYNQKLKDFINEASNEYDNIIIERKNEETKKNIENHYNIENENLTYKQVVLKCKRDLYNLLNSNNLLYTYHLLESILNSNNKEYLCDSFVDLGGLCWDTLFTNKTKNIVVIGAGVCGLYTAVNLKLLIPNCNVLVIDNRVLKDGYKKKYTRRWAMHIEETSIINLFAKKILGSMGKEGYVGSYINMFEMVYFLYARSIDIQFLFKREYNDILTSLKHINYIIDATGNRLIKCKEHLSNLFSKQSISYYDNNYISTNYKIKKYDKTPFILNYYLSKNKQKVCVKLKHRDISWAMSKIINIEYKYLTYVSNLVEKYNDLLKTNKFYLYVTNFRNEINKINIYINLSHSELSMFDDVDVSLRDCVNLACFKNSYLYLFFSELQLVNKSRDKIIIEKKFYYKQYFNVQNKKKYCGITLISVGDSVFGGDPRFNNGLSKHLRILNSCFHSIVSNEKNLW